jgi:prolipoprotein diacylglyceryltransferase
MLSFLQSITWDVSPEILDTEYFSIRWYGLLFALGFLLGQQILIYIFKKEGKPESDVEVLTVYMVLSPSSEPAGPLLLLRTRILPGKSP